MSVIYAHRKLIRKQVYRVKFGMLTDEMSQSSILQLYFHPAFLLQRLTFAAAIVFVYSYPLIQCAIVALGNLTMLYYLVMVRPYKEESQQTSNVVDEIVLFICVLFFIYIYLNQDTMTTD